MESEKTNWIQKYANKALALWRRHEHTVDVSEEYRRQIEIDLAEQYHDPLKREFVETLWAGSPC